MKRAVVGILAHVDAGKTTLAEAILYKTGKIRKAGRVDRGDTQLDTHALERARGITIFAGEAHMSLDGWDICLLDTPGHVDFSAETERTLQVLDYAILVISGTDGVQAHTHTLWRLLELYHIPTFLFVTKMDFSHLTQKALMENLSHELSGACVNFSGARWERDEALALCSEQAMEEYLGQGSVSDAEVRELVRNRRAFPCFFGSGLKMEGVDSFLAALEQLLEAPTYPEAFGARVFKITHNAQGGVGRLTHMKITGGTLHVRDSITHCGVTEKVSEIRLYTGTKYTTVEEASAGTVCAVTGLESTYMGEGLGGEASAGEPVLEPVMNYRIVLPAGVDVQTFLPKLRLLEEEDPQLSLHFEESLQQICVSLMGEVQVEILKSLISERFGVEVTIDSGRVLYRETITDTVEGVGHYEPLRHYAEVHLILSPLERGSGIVIANECREGVPDINWQRLILTHLAEKQHRGVLIGAPITDMKITLAAARAHVKHTEGGDFRQATYRAVRQGLMRAKCVLLEPYYRFRIEVPTPQIGRVISDIRQRCGDFTAPEEQNGYSVMQGRVPVACMNDYAVELAAFTSGRGRLQLEVCGYDVCYNPEEVIAAVGYHPEGDVENTPDSVFCANGAGYTVKWNAVERHMHMESCLRRESPTVAPKRRKLRIAEDTLEAIMEREFGKSRTTQALHRPPSVEVAKKPAADAAPRPQCLIVDGYNCIFAWEELKAISAYDIGVARDRLVDILCNYAAFTHEEVMVVFDGYNVKGNRGEVMRVHNVDVVYTKEHESADIYIQKLVSEIGRKKNVRVVTSDALIQISALHHGALRVSAAEFEEQVDAVDEKIAEFLEKLARESRFRAEETSFMNALEKWRLGSGGEE